jgi:hypothetical protein
VRGFDAKRFARHSFEGPSMARRRPQLELGVAGRANLKEIVVSAIMEFKPVDDLRMTSIEAFSQAQDSCERSDGPPPAPFQAAETLVSTFRGRLSMIPRDKSNNLGFFRFEPAELTVPDQIVGMLVVALVTNVNADIVKNRRVFQQFPFAVGQAMDCPRLLEQSDRKPRDVLRVFRPEIAALRQLEHTPAADVGIPVGLRNFLPVTRNVVEHQTFAERQIAERNVACPESPENFVQQNGADHGQIRAARFETGDAEPLLEIE